MGSSWERSFRQNATAGLFVIGLHVLLIGLLFNAGRRHAVIREPESRSILFLLEPPPELLPSKPEPGPFPDDRARKKSRPQPAADVPPRQDTSDDTAITPAAKSPVDWQVESKRGVREAVAQALEKETGKCNPEGDPKSLLPKCGKEPKYRFEPAPGKLAGKLRFMKQLLPQLEGKRCFASREFTGCIMMGKPPGPGDQPHEYLSLYEYLKHPNRPESSVPDVDEINRPLPSKPPPAGVRP